jgi:hypothetical protein
MRTIKLGIMLCVAGALSFGAVWRGAKLLDASCYEGNSRAPRLGSMCAPTETTTNFAMETRMGHVYKLDAVSNEKTEKALQEGVIAPNRHGDYRARVTGRREANGFIAVNSIVHGSRGEY